MEAERIAELHELVKSEHLFGRHIIEELLTALEHTQGALQDSIEANGHLQNEIERYKVAIQDVIAQHQNENQSRASQPWSVHSCLDALEGETNGS